MKKLHILLAASTALLPVEAFAADQTEIAKPQAFTTGVAKGRDLLDSAISASTLDEEDIQKTGAGSIAQVLGNMPGIHAEAPGTDGYSAISIRGLPLAADGSKYLQIQEDGLPVLEFGDIHFANIGTFPHTDLSLSQVQAIRGGSASTFASNSPGGLVNFISRTGEEEGGVVQFSAGLDHDLNRVDFDYGGHLSKTVRFNIGGFYHQGEGRRAAGYDAFRGGQVKFNITKEFENGYVRLYAKYLDNREPVYNQLPISLTGTNDNPHYDVLPGFDARKDSLYSAYIGSIPQRGDHNQITTQDMHNGMHSVVKSIGLEAQFDVAGWTVTNRFRYSGISGDYSDPSQAFTLPAPIMAMVMGGPGATMQYASGPNAGQPVTDGLVNFALNLHGDIQSLNYAVNDFRASKVWSIGNSKLTTTGGLYASSQDLDMMSHFTLLASTVTGGGNSQLVNVFDAGGHQLTQNGVLFYNMVLTPNSYHSLYDTRYRILAPYGSLNFQTGKLSVGGSLRYDTGKVRGTLYSSDVGGGRPGITPTDINGDGVISGPEFVVGSLPLTQPGVVRYNYHYLSYSAGVNYRIAETLSTFARYSRGARADAERIMFPALLDFNTGTPAPGIGYGPVKQAEAGVKFRKSGVTLFLTGFWASTRERNYQLGADAEGNTIPMVIDRTYSAKGLELEGLLQHGPWNLRMSATWTKGKIDKDVGDPTLNGNRPRQQASLLFTAMPQYESDLFSVGANVNGTTSSYAQDSNLLKQPGYVVVSPFLQVRPTKRVEVALNVFNVFNKLAISQVGSAGVPASGLATALVLNGRTISSSVRISF